MNLIDRNLTFDKPLSALRKGEVEYLILHHEAAPSASVEQVHAYHKGKGWGGIAYHLYVRKDGTVYKGRPMECRGAHTSNYNYKSIGICCEGNFETEQMKDKQFQALLEAIEYVQGFYPAIKIIGHKEVGATACPGKHFPLKEAKEMQRYRTIEDVPDYLRKETKALMDAGVLAGSGGEAGLDVTRDMLRTMIICKKYVDKKK